MDSHNITLSHKEFLALQTEHILRHKYFLSEKVGYDVGIAVAINDWCYKGWADKFRRMYKVVSSKGDTISIPK